MGNEYMKEYLLITKTSSVPARTYSTPEEEGFAIEKCSILKETLVEYSNETTIQTSQHP